MTDRPQRRSHLNPGTNELNAGTIEGGLAGIEWRPIPASELGDGQQMEWVWHGWLARGVVTLLIGIWKGGKTTLLAHILKGFSRGGDIAGSIQKSKCLVISEEFQRLWVRRRDEIGFDNNVHFVFRPFKTNPSMDAWIQSLQKLAELVRAEHYDVVVVDTWQSISPCSDENDAAKTMAALKPLQYISEAGAAVLLVHHPRKGESDYAQASRGSGALTGFVDIIAEFRPFAPQNARDTRRKLRSYSRFEETPKEVVVAWNKNEGYHNAGTVEETCREDRFQTIHTIMGSSDIWLTAEQIHKSWPKGTVQPGLRTVRDDLNVGADLGQWGRSGKGNKGDPYTFGSGNTPP